MAVLKRILFTAYECLRVCRRLGLGVCRLYRGNESSLEWHFDIGLDSRDFNYSLRSL